jgi:CheY-like chemotaxis protein
MKVDVQEEPQSLRPMGPILVLEDEEPLVGAICSQLRREGFDAVSAVDGLAGLGLFRERSPELVILDLMLPLINGLDLCRIIRGESQVPIILTAKKASEAELELVTRVRAHLRRAGMSLPRPRAACSWWVPFGSTPSGMRSRRTGDRST